MRKIGLPEYPLKEAEKGDRLVTMGQYVGESPSKMGTNYNFNEIETGKHIILSGGTLRWRIEQGHVVEGDVYNIDYGGKEALTKGKWAGKETHVFEFELYEDEDLPEKYRKGATAKAEVVAATKPAAAATVAPTEDMDGLE